jgi:hypothetical protein
VRRSGRDRWRGRARPHVDGASTGVVEGWPGGAAPALAGNQCGGATGPAADTPATTAVATTTAAAATTTATPVAPAAASAGGS